MKKPIAEMKNPTPRLGSASLLLTFNDAEGFAVRHGQSPNLILAQKPPEACSDEWDQLWRLFGQMGVEQTQMEDGK